VKKYFILLVFTSCLLFYTGCAKNSEKIQTRISAEEISKTEYVQNENVQIYDNNTNILAQTILKNDDVDKVIIIKTGNNILVGTKLRSLNTTANIYDFKDKVKQEVINQYGNTRDITIITTDDLFKRLEKLASDIKNNKPITGFFEDIGDVVNNVLPIV